MKISNFSKRSFIVFFTVFVVSNVFAGVIIIRKDDGPTPPIAPRMVTSISTVTATEDNSELIVYFSQILGDATITVYDASNQEVYQEVIATDSQSVAFIDISAFATGDYTLTISYGTTNLRGEFIIE